MPRIHEGRMVTLPELTRVVEVGFTDLMAGGQSIACSRLEWIEVHRAVSPPAPVT